MSDARPKSVIEEIGERCLQVCRDHASDKEADARLIADFMWALGVQMTIEFVRPEDTASIPVGLPRENKGVGE